MEAMAISQVFSSSSVSQHFFQPIVQGFNTHLSIPLAFYSKRLEGREVGHEAQLRSDSSEITWKIKMDGHRMTEGWEDFAVAHNLQVGDILVFRHEGNLVFHVTPFGPSCCEILYSQEEDDNNDKDKTGKLNVKRNPKKGCSSSDSDIDFVIPVTLSNLRHDSFYLPRGLTTSSGKSSTLETKYHKSSKRFHVRRGWRAFCCKNEHKTGCSLRLVLVRNGTKPILRMIPLERDEDEDIGKHSKKKKKNQEVEHESLKEKKNVEFLSLSDNSIFVVSVTVSNLREDRLFLPVRFSRSNILKERFHEISLMNKQGRTWMLRLKYRQSSEQFYITKGWRSFCGANGLKAGCSFLFKLVVRNITAPFLLMTSEDSSFGHLLEKKHSQED
ncbi:unnamed protein product [Thlaspi arvense]|uniref:TF-B3 domain-containing protein n=1 Tax=Thlaspi arvense TaxID=13288 RepID=A0AAU9T5L8_THLAR|nr:unnamed protein product [Thlaspi arvense]